MKIHFDFTTSIELEELLYIIIEFEQMRNLSVKLNEYSKMFNFLVFINVLKKKFRTLSVANNRNSQRINITNLNITQCNTRVELLLSTLVLPYGLHSNITS